MKHKRLSVFSLWFFSLCSLCLCGSFLSAASPALNAVNPRGGQRGTEVALSFTGGRLTDAKEVHVYYPGISVTKVRDNADADVNDTLLVLKNAGRGVYRSLYYWMLSDSITGNSRAFEERDFYCVPDGRSVHLSTGTEDYCGYYYNWESAGGLGSRTADFHGSPTFGRRKDGKFLDAFYRIHELDRIPFEKDFVFYWESWPDWPKIPQSRYCHIGYCVIYYLEHL